MGQTLHWTDEATGIGMVNGTVNLEGGVAVSYSTELRHRSH